MFMFANEKIRYWSISNLIWIIRLYTYNFTLFLFTYMLFPFIRTLPLPYPHTRLLVNTHIISALPSGYYLPLTPSLCPFAVRLLRSSLTLIQHYGSCALILTEIDAFRVHKACSLYISSISYIFYISDTEFN
jgi:hypothetical protein